MKALFSRGASRFSGPVIVVVCTGAVVLTFVTLGYVVPRFVKSPAFFAPTPAPLPPVFYTTAALFTPTDETRLTAIGTALQAKKPISDADLDWAIDLLQRGPVLDSPFTRTSFVIRTLSQLGNHHSLTPAQCRSLAQAVLPYADDPPLSERASVEVEDGRKIQSSAVSLQSVAVITLASLDDDLARAKLASLAQSSATPKIRREAAGFFTRQRERNAKPSAKNTVNTRN